MPSPTPEPAPNWAAESRALAARGRMRDAEAVIQRAVTDLGCHAALASLWADRMRALRAGGDRRRASDAYHRAAMWAHAYAAGATSGGEGLALSAERDEMLAEYRTALGFDPGGDPTGDRAKAAIEEA